VLQCPYDPLDREYRPGKGIVVPDSSDDDIYRGEYYPRRPSFDTTYVSIEMKRAFSGARTRTTEIDPRMIVIAGIYDRKSEADSTANRLGPAFKDVHVFEDSLFLGCMH
jgi:hypothetical protein